MTRNRRSFVQHLLLFLLALAGCGSALAQDTQATGELPVVASKEYIFQQQAGETLVVRVSAFEAAFLSRVSSEPGGVLVESGLRDARMLPLFQFIPTSDESRQVNINVDAANITGRTEFGMELTRLNIRDQRSRSIAAAYQTLSAGIALMPNGSAPQWTVRIQNLFSAAEQFRAIGMEEMRLWSRTFGAHLVLTELQEYETAVDWSGELLGQPRISRYPELEFTAKKLRSTAMAQGGIGIGGNDPVNSPFQQALAATIESAKSLGYRYEESLALMSGGVDLIDHGLNRQAQGFLASALEIALEIEANDLAASIREQMVEAYSQAGEVEATGGILEDIETHLVDEGDQQELALNLIQQGQVHIEGHRYSRAIEVLERAVSLEQSELSRLGAELELGMALSAAGRAEEAIVHLYRAVFNTRTGEFRQPGNVLNISAALYELAAIFRQQGDWNRLQEIRAEQGKHLNSSARRSFYAHHLAKDALFRFGPGSSTTRDRYDRAFRQADGAGQEGLRHLARLGLCSLPDRAAGEESICRTAELRNSYAGLQASELSHRKAEAALYYARIQERAGRTDQALETVDELVRSLIDSGYTSLGSWYWRWRDALISDYLSYAIGSEREGRRDASQSFTALVKARRLERGGSLQTPVNSESLAAYLGNMPGDVSVLSYYLAEDSAIAWVAGREGVQRRNLSAPSRIRSLSAGIRNAQGRVELNRLTSELGSLLLDPLAGDLESSVYLASHSPLLGIPFDLLHVNGEPMAQQFRLAHIELASLEPRSNNWLEMPPRPSVFLAGDPREWTGDFAFRMDSDEELRAVGDFFIGRGLHTVQGIALLVDEFADERYGNADLIHLSIPGVIDLAGRTESALYLSEPARGAGPERLMAGALGALPVQARLVFLSRTEFRGTSRALENRKGVVSSLLDAGAHAVIASLWPLEPEFRTRFVENFYNRLAVEGNVLAAFAMTKRDFIAAGELTDWAGLQLFLD